MKKLSLLALALLLGGLTSARADLSGYQFYVGTGSGTNMASATTIIGNGVDDGTSGIQNIGFTFVFNGVSYTQYSVSSNGAMRLGSTTVTGGFGNSLTATLPMIAGFYDDMHTGVYDAGGYVKAVVTGSAPNRVLSIEWRVRAYGSSLGTEAEIYRWQVRLYETSNKIEFYYSKMRSDYTTSASIGIAASGTANDFISVTPGSPISFSRTAINNSANIGSTTNAFNANLLLTFSPCLANVSIAGNPAQGGTLAMNEGDSLLLNREVSNGEDQTFQPFTVSLGGAIPACASRQYIYLVTGTFAADYSISPQVGVLNDGQTNTPQLTFRPSGLGVRTATLIVLDDNGFFRTYNLAGVGVPRIAWIGNPAQGGTPELNDADLLMQSVEVNRNSSGSFTPITIKNNGANLSAPPAQVTYTIIDPTGQYSISPTSASLSAGQSSTPTITFTPTLTGEQRALLRVNADGEVRTFSLAAYSLAPSAEFTLDGTPVVSGATFFNRTVLCMSDIVTVPVTIRNTNRVNVEVNEIIVYATDSEIRQGAPPYPILRDQFGDRMRSIEYILTEQPGQAPYLKNPRPSLPVVIAPGETKTLYLNYLPISPGFRFARMFIRTNSENFTGAEIGSYDPGSTPVQIEGLFNIDLFGKAIGSKIAGENDEKLPRPLTFDDVDIREREVAKTWVQNNGECDLLISKSEVRIMNGDVNEFELLSVFPNTSVSGDNYVFPPGTGDSIVAAFAPATFGSRRASIRLVTNDSTLVLPGVSERGAYYLDLYGVGKVGLEARNLRLNPAVIDGESSHGTMSIENTSGEAVTVIGIEIVGGNGEIVEDGAKPWPSLPVVLVPGQQLDLGFALVPAAGGAEGVREAQARLLLNNGDTVVAVISGYAGKRTLAVSPGAAFTTTKIAVGELARTVVVLSNTGTLPVRLNDPAITGVNKDDYTISPLRRRVLEPGQIEVFELTYVPQVPGASSAQLEFGSNATNGLLTVQLGGEASSTIHVDDPSGSSATQVTPGADLSRASAALAIDRLTFRSVAPNPARSLVDVTFVVPGQGTVELGLYDATGALVKMVDKGDFAQGEHTLRVDLTGLSSGTYYCALRQGDHLVTRTVTVVR